MGKQLGRKNNKRKLKWILAGIVIALLLAGGGIYAGFMVTDITYTGNKHYTQQQKTRIIRMNNLKNIYLVVIMLICYISGFLDKKTPKYHLSRNMMLRRTGRTGFM